MQEMLKLLLAAAFAALMTSTMGASAKDQIVPGNQLEQVRRYDQMGNPMKCVVRTRDACIHRHTRMGESRGVAENYCTVRKCLSRFR
jgi:hypothetical protein